MTDTTWLGTNMHWRVATGALFVATAVSVMDWVTAGTCHGIYKREVKQKMLTFTSIVEPPFLTYYDKRPGNSRFVGFIPDLIFRIARRLRMPYRIKLVAEGGYGVPRADGSWNGMIGEVMRGEADIAAGALSYQPWRARVVNFTIPFFTAGIAAVLKKVDNTTGHWMNSTIQLAGQNQIQYGAIAGSLTQRYFRASNNSVLRRMWNQMYRTQPSVFERSSTAGIERVRRSNGTYAFLLESAFAEYLVNRPPCDLFATKELLNPSEYGFAVRKGANKLLKRINKVLIVLRDKGEIDRLRRRWWRGKCNRLARKKGVPRSSKVAPVAPRYNPNNAGKKMHSANLNRLKGSGTRMYPPSIIFVTNFCLLIFVNDGLYR